MNFLQTGCLLAAMSCVPRATSAQTILEFPESKAVGSIEIRPAKQRTQFAEFLEPWDQAQPAQGKVEIPEGHEVRLWISADGAMDMSFLGGFPVDALYCLDLWRSRAEDAQVKHIARLTGLRQLILRDTRLTPAGLKELGSLTELRLLSCSAYMPNRELEPRAPTSDPFAGSPIADRSRWKFGFDDASLSMIADMPQLVSLQIRANPITYKSLLTIGQLKNLQSLSLEQMRIEDRGLELLRNLKSLDHLSFGVYNEGAPITDVGVSKIALIPNLKTLNLNGSKITVQGLRHLTAMDSLEELNVEGIRFAPDELSVLAGCKSLKKLSADWNHSEWRSYGPELAKIRTLETVGQNVNVDPEGLAAILSLPNLKSLSVFGPTPLGFTGLGKHFNKCKQLEDLSLQSIDIDDDDLLAMAGLTKLQNVGLMKTAIRGPGLRILASLPNLKTVYLSSSSSTKMDISFLPTLPPSCKHLGLGDDGLLPNQPSFFAKLKGISSCQIDSLIRDNHLAAMEQITALKSMSLRNSALSDAGLVSLMKLDKLDYATVGGALTLEGLSQLKGHPNLRSLWVSSPYFGPEQVTTLEAILGSVSINVQGGDRVKFPGLNDGFLRMSSKGRLGQDAMEGRPAPQLHCEKWFNRDGSEFQLDEFQGKALLLRFVSTWQITNDEEIQRSRQIQEKFGDKLAIVWLVRSSYAGRLAGYRPAEQITWPVALDDNNKSADAFLANNGYHLIAPQGTLLFNDLAPDDLEKAIAHTLNK